MSLEFVIALSLIVAISELKEWHASKRHKELIDGITILDFDIKKMISESVVMRTKIEATENISCELSEKLKRIEELSQKSEVNSATILKEYELNGIPLGYQRKKPEFDYIEGL